MVTTLILLVVSRFRVRSSVPPSLADRKNSRRGSGCRASSPLRSYSSALTITTASPRCVTTRCGPCERTRRNSSLNRAFASWSCQTFGSDMPQNYADESIWSSSRPRGSDESLKGIGCGGRARTSDHRINNPALYQLSYTTARNRKGRPWSPMVKRLSNAGVFGVRQRQLPLWMDSARARLPQRASARWDHRDRLTSNGRSAAEASRTPAVRPASRAAITSAPNRCSSRVARRNLVRASSARRSIPSTSERVNSMRLSVAR